MSSITRTRTSNKKSTPASPAKLSPSQVQKGKIASSLTIEERSLAHLMNSKRKLESLKKSIEQEELKELQDKPKILMKSRILAERAEKRLLSSPYPENPSPEEASPKEYLQVQPEIQEIIPQPRTPNPEKREIRPAKQPGKRTKSLLNLSVLERSEIWLQEREQKLNVIRQKLEEKDLSECTFSPETQSKSRDWRSSRDYAQSNLSFLSYPNSIIEAEFQDQGSKISRPQLYKQIAPYQVKISFKCGIDLNSFLRRAK